MAIVNSKKVAGVGLPGKDGAPGADGKDGAPEVRLSGGKKR